MYEEYFFMLPLTKLFLYGEKDTCLIDFLPL